MEVIVDSTVINEMIIMDNFPPIPLPLTIKTPIIEVESDYGNPYIDAFMIDFVLAVVFGFRRLIKKYG